MGFVVCDSEVGIHERVSLCVIRKSSWLYKIRDWVSLCGLRELCDMESSLLHKIRKFVCWRHGCKYVTGMVSWDTYCKISYLFMLDTDVGLVIRDKEVEPDVVIRKWVGCV